MKRLLDILVLIILTPNNCLLLLSVSSYAEANHIEIDDLYVGCFLDRSSRMLPELEVKSDTIHPRRCVEMCYARGYLYAGLEVGDECWCGDNLQHVHAPREQCSSRCSNGGKLYECGGHWRISVYRTTLSGDYWTVYTWDSVIGTYKIFGTRTRIVKKEFIVVGDKAGRSVFKTLKPSSIIPYCAESCEWEATDSVLVFFNTLRTTTKDLLLERVCLTVETTSMKGSLVLGLEHESKAVVLLEVMKVDGVQRLEAELPPEYKWKPVRLYLKFRSVTTFEKVKRIAGCIPGMNMDKYQVSMAENESPNRKLYAKDAGVEGGSCENAGIFTGSGCICRVGFSGPSCENICGENRFGPNCEGRCSSKTTGCSGKLFCKSGEGCGCANGFTGEDCMTSCAVSGSYGVDCSQRCGSCLGACNVYTGECERGCKQGYVPPLCKDKWVHLASNYLTLESVNHTTATLAADLTDAVFSGEHQHAYHSLQYKISLKSEEWKRGSELNSALGKQRFVLEGLSPSRDYQARLVVYTSTGEYYQGDDLPYLDFSTTCSENPLKITLGEVTARSINIVWKGTEEDPERCQTEEVIVAISSCYVSDWVEYKGSGGEGTIRDLAPATFYCIRIKQTEPERHYYTSAKTLPADAFYIRNLRAVNITQRSVEVEWESNVVLHHNFTVHYKCLRLMARLTEACENDEGSLEVEEGRALIEALHPFREYAVWVDDPTTLNDITITFVTQPSVPSVKAEFVNLTSTNSSVTLNWGPPESCSGCNGVLDHYEVILMDQKGKYITKSVQEITEKTREVLVEGLESMTDYVFTILLYNNVGHNDSTVLSLNFTTKPSVPSEVCDLEVYKVTRNSVGLRWAPPLTPSGQLVQFVVNTESPKLGKSMTTTLNESSSYCNAWPDRYCTVITGLKHNTAYNLTVSAVNVNIPEKGSQRTVTAITKESAPGPPLNLKASRITEHGLKLDWEPPSLLNGNLRSFLVNIDQTDSQSEESCCDVYPKVDVVVNNEQPIYSAELTGLEAGGTYAVSVMAITVWLGPAAMITVQTRPQPPASPPGLKRTDPESLKWTVDTTSDEDQPPVSPPGLNKTDPESLEWTVDTTTVEDQPPATYMLFVVAENGSLPNDTAETNQDLRGQVEAAIQKPLYYITNVQAGDEISLESGGALEGVLQEGLDENLEYSLALVAVSSHNDLHTVSVSKSQPFIFR